MSLTSQEYADLSADSYQDRKVRDEPYEINGVSYRVLNRVDNPNTGYQGTVYQRVDTGEVVVAHRGTEFKRELLKDGLLADGGMVLARSNLQVDDAVKLTRWAVDYADDKAKETGKALPVTVTGHSMGGTLAQVTAHYFDLKGETFNPYGAASLNLRIPEGGDSVINHVMAGDVVSAASPHFGQVRVYATQKEIDNFDDKGYENNDSRWFDLRNPFGAAVNGISSHYMDNFTDKDSDGRPDRSVLGDPQAQILAEHNAAMIGKYRDDVRYIRSGLTTVVDVVTVRGVVNNVADTIRGDLRPGEPAELERQRQLADKERPPFTLPDDSIRSPAARNAAASGVFDQPAESAGLGWQRQAQGKEQPVFPLPDDSMRSPAARNATASGLFDRLYTSMKSGDDHEFKHALANVADSDFNREFRGQVVANVDAQEQRSALQAQQQQQQQREAEQVEAPRRSAMMH